MKIRLSRKKLTQKEALDKISHLYMRIQNEQEYLVWLSCIKSNATRADLLILAMTNVDSVDKEMEETRERLRLLERKAKEDYGRFVGEGVHILSCGMMFVKQ